MPQIEKESRSRGRHAAERKSRPLSASARGTVRVRSWCDDAPVRTHALTRERTRRREGEGGVHRLERWSSRCPMVQPPTPSESYHCAGCATPWGHHLSMWGTERAWCCSGGGRAARGVGERRGLAAREGNQVCGEGTRGVPQHRCGTLAWWVMILGGTLRRNGRARAGRAAQRREGEKLAMHTRRVHGLCACRAPLRALTLCVVRLCRWRLDGLTAVTVALLMSQLHA